MINLLPRELLPMKKIKNFADIPQTFRLTIDEKKVLDDLAIQHDASKSDLIRALLKMTVHFPQTINPTLSALL